MSEARILTQAQAEAIYSAMRALNNVGAKIHVSVPPTDDRGDWIFADECTDSGQITLTKGLRRVACYSSQATFVSAYGLGADERDPLQGAADWLVESHPELDASKLAGKLSIGYNRAGRLRDSALAKATQ